MALSHLCASPNPEAGWGPNRPLVIKYSYNGFGSAPSYPSSSALYGTPFIEGGGASGVELAVRPLHHLRIPLSVEQL